MGQSQSSHASKDQRISAKQKSLPESVRGRKSPKKMVKTPSPQPDPVPELLALHECTESTFRMTETDFHVPAGWHIRDGRLEEDSAEEEESSDEESDEEEGTFLARALEKGVLCSSSNTNAFTSHRL